MSRTRCARAALRLLPLDIRTTRPLRSGCIAAGSVGLGNHAVKRVFRRAACLSVIDVVVFFFALKRKPVYGCD